MHEVAGYLIGGFIGFMLAWNLLRNFHAEIRAELSLARSELAHVRSELARALPPPVPPTQEPPPVVPASPPHVDLGVLTELTWGVREEAERRIEEEAERRDREQFLLRAKQSKAHRAALTDLAWALIHPVGSGIAAPNTPTASRTKAGSSCSPDNRGPHAFHV
jgi:hypothetical protein